MRKDALGEGSDRRTTDRHRRAGVHTVTTPIMTREIE